MRRLTLAAILFLTALLAPRIATFAAAPAANDQIVVLISLDGFCGYYLDDPKAEIPTLRKLMADGARAASMKASNPTVTWTNHTTLVTGVYPAKHGVVGNNFYDRAAGKRMVLIGDPTFDKDQIVRVPTIYDAAKKAGLKTASVRWPATRNAKTLDWTMGDVLQIELLKKTATPSLKAEATEAGIWAEIDAAEKREKDGKYLPSDEMCTKLLNLILRKHRPNLAMLHFIDVDHEEHAYGPRSAEAYAAIKANDTHVGEVWKTLQDEYPGKATLIVVSDHGFSPNKRQLLPNVVLKKAKLIKEKEDDAEKPLLRLVMQGGCAMIYILDDARRDETVAKIKEAFKGIDGVSKVVGPDELPKYGVASAKDDPHAPDVILFTDVGWFVGDTAAGDLPFMDKPERKGSHGHDASFPELHAMFVAWGAGIKHGAKVGEIENTAVTPTIAKLLGLSMQNLDGKPVDEVLEKP